MAAELIGLIIEIVKPLVNPVWRQIDYFWNYKGHIAKLKVDIEETLKDEKVNLDHNVDNANRKGNKVEDDVGRWVNNANELVKNAETFLRNDENESSENNKCRVIFGPNWIKRHQRGRKAKKMSEKVAELIKDKREKFDSRSIFYREGPKGLAPIKDYEVFESRTSIFEDIMRALRNPDVTKIGVYGINGVGKTTLVRKIASQAMEEQLVNEVAMATVFQDQNMKEMDGEEAAKPDLRRIQGEIKDWLEFEFQKETEIGRAEELRERLTKDDKKIKRLVILDNIWEGLKLEEIGIPDNHEECKILMTSTDDNVLRSGMGSTNNFQLDVLQPWEARKWFKKMVSDVVKDPSFEQVAGEVADKCVRLPILLFTVANVLKDKKDLSAWKNALIQLSSYDKEEMHHHVHLALRLSYRFLKGEAIKKLFLLCGRLPPNDISIDYLLRYSRGLGLFKNCKTLADTRNTVLALVADLKASSLLVEGNKQGELKMHDIVRNFAMSVESLNFFTVASGNELRQWPEKVDLEQYTAISLPYCKTPELPDEFEFRNLKSFLLFSKDPLVKVPENFFRRMKKLKVLHLRNIPFLSSLPLSLQFLTNLRTLCFDECKLDGVANMGIIGKLKNLEILSFRGSDIVQLPKEIAQLSHLLVLDLSDCRALKVIPENLLLGLQQLEDLHMENLCLNWEVDGKENKLNELASLTNLSTLDMHITDPMILPMDLFSNKLERFKILIGNGWDWSGEYQTSRTLKLKLNGGVLSKKGVQLLLKKAEELYLYGLEDVQTSLDEVDSHGFPQLKHLHVESGHEIQYINSVRRGSSAAFTRLESLSLHKLKNLKKISHGTFVAESFGNLRMLNVEDCDSLKNLFSTSMARGLLHLEEFNISDCKILEEIVIEENGDDSDRVETVNLPQLHKLTLKSLPQFTSFWSKKKEIELENGAEASTPLFGEKVFCPNLKKLKLLSINIEKIWQDQLPGTSSSFQNLTKVNVEGCNNLKYLLSFSMMEILVNLKSLRISNCRMMKVVMDGFQEEMVLQHLEYLHLENLPKLAGFCSCNLLKFPALRSLEIYNCPKVRTFVPNSYGVNKAVSNEAEMTNSVLFNEKVAFPNLEDLWIFNMAKLKRIWHSDLHDDSFCKLSWLYIWNAKELLNIFPSSYVPSRFQNLVSIFVDNCESLREVFDAQPLVNVKEKNTMTTAKLRSLYLERLPNLRHVWTKETIEFLSFQNIRTVSASLCPNLKSLFPVSLAKGLMQLQRLVVKDCGVEEIISMEEGEEAVEAVERFQFPQLTDFRLQNLPEFKKFYSGRHTVEWLALETLRVEDCDKIEIFSSEQDQLETPLQQPLFKLEEVMPNLIELPLNSKLVRMIQKGQFSESLFHKVKSLHLQCFHDKSAALPWNIIERFDHLENLILRNSCFAEVFSHVGSTGNEGRCLSKIKKLTLDSLYNLKRIQLDTVTEHLETLKIWHCNSLTSLAPFSASFRNLKVLKVKKCERLAHLITSSTVKSLGKLTEISISGCNMMTEIVANNGDDEEDVIVFHKLETLTLDCLTSLTCFCSVNCTFEFPSLVGVGVTQCPKMSVFSQANVHTPKLRRVWARTEKKLPQQDLNTAVKMLYADLVGFNGLKHFKLSEFPELEGRWPDQLPVKFFYYSRSLVVDKCASCRSAIPSNLLPFLNNLEELEVRCVSVEEVFDVEKLNAEDEVGHLAKLNKFHLIDLPKLSYVWIANGRGMFDFGNLKLLKIHNCDSLRHVLTPAIVLGLVKLQEIEIKSCHMIEEIIHIGAAQEAIAGKLTFPQLDSIILESLPNLACFYLGSGIVECPLVKKIAVVDCPSAFTSIFLPGRERNAREGTTEREVAFPNLEKLRVEWNDTMEEFWHGQFQAEFFCQLKTFELINFPNDDATLPSHFLQRLPSLENLVLTYAEEIVLYKETNYEEHQLGALPHLRELKLSKLPKPVLLSKEDLESSLVFQNLETLEVCECCKLKTLVPPSVSFGHLKVLEVSKCHALINLMTISVANSLVQLARMSVTECGMIEEIIAKDETETDNEVVFRKLECLRLHCLDNLTSFYSGKYKFIFPSLEELEVSECPNIEISSWGSISMPKLNKVQLEEGEDKVYSEGNLNAPVLKLFMEVGQAAKSMPSSPRPATSVPETSQVEKNNTVAASDGKASENIHASEIPDLGKDQLGNVDTAVKVSAEEEAFKNASLEPEITTMAQRSKGLHAVSSDKEDFTQNQNSPIIPHNGTYISQKDPQAIAKVQVMLASSIQQSTVPELHPTVIEQIPQSSYGSSNETIPSNEPACGENFRSIFDTPSFSIVDRISHSPVNFESLFSKAEDLLKPGPESLPQSLSSVPDAEFHKSIRESSETLDQFKKILKKTLAEVATSADVFLLLSSLKNLKNHPHLNPEQLDIIQDYVENFDSLVTYHPFYEQQINASSLIKTSIEDSRNGVTELKTLYGEFTSKASALNAEKEALKERFREIVEEEGYIQANMEALYANLVTKTENLETNTNALPEAVRGQRVAEDRVSKAIQSWNKLRSLFP